MHWIASFISPKGQGFVSLKYWSPKAPFLRDAQVIRQCRRATGLQNSLQGSPRNEIWLKFLLDSDEIRLGHYRFNPGALDLRDQNGDRVKLRKKSLEVLARVSSDPGTVVSKDEILASVWPDVAVTEESLTQCVAEIRKAIQDKDHSILVNHVGRGYSIETSRRSEFRINRRFAATAVLVALLAAILAKIWLTHSPPHGQSQPRIAVLAFDDLSAGPDRGFLGNGVAASLTTELARYREIQVIASNSSFQFRNSDLGLVKIADALRADYLVEGSKQKFGNRMRVSVQLVDGRNEAQIWAEDYEGDIGDLFNFQSRIVHEITNRIGHEVSRNPPPSGTREVVNSLNYFLLGMEEFQKDTLAGTLAARDLFHTAIETDPEAPFGYVGAVWVLWRDLWSNQVSPNLSRQDKLKQAEILADKALQLDPNYHLAHVARADIHVAAGELEEARVRFQTALDLNPNDVLVLVSATDPLVFLGEGETAIEMIQRAIDLNPLTPGWYFHQLAWAEWSIGRCDAGLATLQKMAVANPSSLRVKAALEVCVGDVTSAQRTMAKYRGSNPGRTVEDEIADFSGSWRNPATMALWSEAMRVSGMPESR